MTKPVILKTDSEIPIILAAVADINAKIQHALAVFREYDRLYDKQPTIMILPLPKKYSRKQK